MSEAFDRSRRPFRARNHRQPKVFSPDLVPEACHNYGPSHPSLESGSGNGTTASAAIFLSAEDKVVPPERKQAGLPSGSLTKEHGTTPSRGPPVQTPSAAAPCGGAPAP